MLVYQRVTFQHGKDQKISWKIPQPGLYGIPWAWHEDGEQWNELQNAKNNSTKDLSVSPICQNG
jgi:hypothetical protein